MLHIEDAFSGEPEASIQVLDFDYIDRFAVSGDGKFVSLARESHPVQLFALDSGERRCLLPNRSGKQLALSGDHRFLATTIS